MSLLYDMWTKGSKSLLPVEQIGKGSNSREKTYSNTFTINYDPTKIDINETTLIMFEGNYVTIPRNKLSDIQDIALEKIREKDPNKKEFLEILEREYILKAISEYENKF